jgi:cytochrome c553
MKTDILTLVAALAAPLALAGCSNEPELPPEGTAQQLMAQQMQPTAEIYWESVGASSELVDGEPVFREWAPETDAEWEAVRAAAMRLGELGELLKDPAYSDGRGDDWLAYAKGLVDVSAQAEQAAVAQDAEAVFEVGGTIYTVCSACHRMYPPEELPEGVTVDDLQQAQDTEEGGAAGAE